MPAERVDYDVNAWLRARGNFAAQMQRNAAAVRPVISATERFGTTMERVGTRVMGTTARTAMTFGKLTAAIGGAAAAGGLLALARAGADFYVTMERATLATATMYQMFDLGANAANVVTGEMSQWQYNLAQSKATMKSLYEVAKKTPATFRDVAVVYQNAAAGLSLATKDLEKHEKFMERAALLGPMAENYQVLGRQMGRIMSGAAGAEMTIWQQLKVPLIRAGKQLGIFNREMRVTGDDATQAFNQAITGSQRLQLMMAAMEAIGEETAEAYRRSWDGITSTTRSALETISGEFMSPIVKGFHAWLVEINEKAGIFGEQSTQQWFHIMRTMGGVVAKSADRFYGALERGAIYLRDNWVEAVVTMKEVFWTGSALIKAAFAFGLTRMAAGATMMMAGRGIRGVAAGRRAFGGARERYAPKMAAARAAAMVSFGRAGMGLGARGGGIGVFGMIMGKLALLGGTKTRGALTFITKFGAMAAVLAPMAGAATILAGAFGAVTVLLAGFGAYLISKWDEIAGAIRKGLEEGTINLRPLILAASVFWAKLVAVGEAFVGSEGPAGIFNTILWVMTTALNSASSVIALFTKALSYLIDIWGVLKLAMSGLMQMSLGLMEGLRALGAVDPSTVERGRAALEGMLKSTAGTLKRADRMRAAAERIEEITEKEIDFAAAEKRAQALSEKIIAALTPGKEEEDKPKPPRRPGVTIQKVEVIQDLRDTDPDRLLSAFIQPLERMAERNVQSMEMLEEGI